jgi:hypothetical protein
VLSHEEIVKVWTASLEAVSTDFGAFVRLLLVSGQRKGQWQQFRPEFMYLDKLIFPAGVMKGDKEHTISLTPLMERIIGNHSFRE